MVNNCNKTFRDMIESGQAQALGIVSIVPMGDWNATTTYQKLNYVRHNGATYLAKTSSKNVEPGVAQNWQDVWMLCNYDGGVSQVVSDGTYPNMTVGKATTSLYNLGAFDTYVDNGDGTVTVTRKTGYYKIDGNFTVGLTWYEYPNLVSVKIPNVEYETDLVASIITVFDVWNDGNPQYDYAMADHTNSNVGVRVVVKNATSMQEFRNYVSQNPISVEYELQTSEQYTEKLPANVPLNTLDANMSDIVRDEVEKTLNLADISKQITINSGTEQWVSYTIALKAGTYTISSSNIPDGIICQISINGNFVWVTNTYYIFTINNDLSVSVRFGNNQVSQNTTFTPTVMLNEGDHAYPYQPYNGAIVHEIRTPLYFSTDNVSPASIDQIGGNWTSLGSFMVGSNTIYAWKKA